MKKRIHKNLIYDVSLQREARRRGRRRGSGDPSGPGGSLGGRGACRGIDNINNPYRNTNLNRLIIS